MKPFENKWMSLKHLLPEDLKNLMEFNEFPEAPGRGLGAVQISVVCPGSYPREEDFEILSQKLIELNKTFGIRGSVEKIPKCLGSCETRKNYILTTFPVLAAPHAKKFHKREELEES